MLTSEFINQLFLLKTKAIPDRVYHQARRCFLDYLGVCLAGAKAYNDSIDKFILSNINTCGDVSVVGSFYKLSMQNAALINGINAHAIELDDGHRIGMLHLGAPIISALLAVAEKEELKTEKFFLGIIIGYEVAIRLACCIQPGNKLKGYHATGTCGTVGAAMGIAAALDFDFDQMKSGLSAAITSAAGVLEMIVGDTQLKPYNAGRAAMDGVTAAYIGKARFKAPEDALGGKRGFLAIMTDEPKLKYLTDWSEGRFMIETIYMKPYAACRHCHPSIEASLVIREKEGFNLGKVEHIDVNTYKLAVEGHDHTRIEGINSAKMSIPFSIAVALCFGKAGMEEFSDERVKDPVVLDVAHKVSVVSRDDLSALCPQKRVAIVTVVTSSGIFEERVEYPKGEPENPMTEDELKTKFTGLATYGGLTEKACDAVINEVFKEKMDLTRIISLL